MPQLCDIFSSIKNVYRTSKFFGIFPYTIETINGETKAIPSHYAFLFTVLTSLVIFAHGVTFPFYVFGSEVPCFFCAFPSSSYPNSTQTITVMTPFMFQKIALKIINRMVVSMMSFCTIFFALFFSSSIPAFIKKLNDMDYFIRALLQHSEKTVTCCISEWIVSGLLLGSMPAVLYYMYTDISTPDSTVTSVAWMVVLMWDNLISAVCECLFINFAYLIKVRFEIINNYLMDLQTPLESETNDAR